MRQELTAHRLTRLNDGEAFDLARDRPRKSAASPQLSATFALEPDEQASLAGIHGGSSVRRITISKGADGKKAVAVRAPPVPRQSAACECPQQASRARRLTSHRVV